MNIGNHCPLCASPGGRVVWRGGGCRIVIAEDARAPTLRVVWAAHVREMSDLGADGRAEMMAAVWATEETLRALLRPDKINLASLGNEVPHVHWHVIARFRGDPWFPDAIWAPTRRAGVGLALDCKTVGAALALRLGPGDT